MVVSLENGGIALAEYLYEKNIISREPIIYKKIWNSYGCYKWNRYRICNDKI